MNPNKWEGHLHGILMDVEICDNYSDLIYPLQVKLYKGPNSSIDTMSVDAALSLINFLQQYIAKIQELG